MRRLAISLLCAILVATVGLGWLFDTLYLEYMSTKTTDQQLHSQSNHHNDTVAVMEQLGANYAKLIDAADKPEVLVEHWPTDQPYQLVIKSLDSLNLPEELLSRFYNAEPLVLETRSEIEIHFYLPHHQQRLVLSSPAFDKQQDGLITAYIFTGLFYFLLLLLMFLWLNPLIKRLLVLRTVASKFGQGQLDQRIELGSISYIRDLEFEFNRMAQRIEDLVSDVKLLSSAVSHDLRTPLASIRFGIDTLQEEDDLILRRKFEQRISNDVDEMITLVETLLSYARLDQAMLELDKSEVQLVPLLEQLIVNKKRSEKSIELVIEQQNLMVLADKRYLSMMLNNILQNAIQYCNDKIVVRVNSADNTVHISVNDDGKGIPECEREIIIKPFVRGDKTRSAVKGFGIGLAIVNRVLHWHNGLMEISQDPILKGAQINIYLPRYTAADKAIHK